MYTTVTWSWRALLVCGLTVASPYTAQAKDFRCGAGDVACLINAIHTSNANGKKNTIRLKAGTYALTTVDNNTDGPNGLPSITGTLTIEGEGASRTAIVGQADTGVELRLLHVATTGVVVLKDLTLRDGYIDGQTPGHFFGGAGIYSLGSLTLRDAAIRDNLSLFAPGAGIRSFGPLTIVDSALSGNVSLPDGAGAIESAGSLKVTGTLITQNYGDWVGGIAATGTTVIARSSLVANGGHLAGAMANYGQMTLTDSVVARNDAAWVGGILNGDVGSVLGVTSTTIAENIAYVHFPGGLSNEGGEIHLLNSTVVRNKHLSDPFWEGVSPGIGNMPSWNSGAFGTVTLLNTILAENAFGAPPTTDMGGGPDCGGPVTSRGTNLVGDPTDCDVALQASDLTGDPGLGAFVDEGEPGEGHVPLLPTSPAIDAANDDASPRRDQLGERRVDIRRVGSSRGDIGAVEFQHR